MGGQGFETRSGMTEKRLVGSAKPVEPRLVPVLGTASVAGVQDVTGTADRTEARLLGLAEGGQPRVGDEVP